MKIITVLYSLSPEHLRKVSLITSWRLQMFFAGIYAVIASLIVSVTAPAAWTVSTLLFLAVFIGYGTLLTFSGNRLSVIRRLNGRLLENRRMMEFDDEGFHSRSDSGSHSFTVWGDVLKVAYKYQTTYIYLSRLVVIQVPDSAFPSSIERNQLHSLLRAKALLK